MLHIWPDDGIDRKLKHVATLSFKKQVVSTEFLLYKVPYFPAHKTHRNFFVRNFRKKKNIDECILILVIYWKKTRIVTYQN
jgi:hypothetical protein